MLRSDIVDILHYAKQNFSGKLSLMINGTLFNPENVCEIVKLVSSIDISIDGVDEESCSVIRGSGTFDKVINSIHLLKESEFNNITLSMVLSENNVNLSDRFFELNENLGTRPMPRVLSLTGRAEKNRELLRTKFTDEEIKQKEN